MTQIQYLSLYHCLTCQFFLLNQSGSSGDRCVLWGTPEHSRMLVRQHLLFLSNVCQNHFSHYVHRDSPKSLQITPVSSRERHCHLQPKTTTLKADSFICWLVLWLFHFVLFGDRVSLRRPLSQSKVNPTLRHTELVFPGPYSSLIFSFNFSFP